MVVSRCGGACYENPYSLLTIDNVLQCQKISDFLIALAYFSIPIELFYFATCAAIFPFRWVLLQFGSFIVLCGLTHLATTFTYAPHSFLLVLTLTLLKFLTALVSIATAITLLTLIPHMLRVFVREELLREKTKELDREVRMMKRREEAGWFVRMVTTEIRRSLDRHTILYTTLVELSKALVLEHCAIWMPSDHPKKTLVLAHEMSRRDVKMMQQARRRSRWEKEDDDGHRRFRAVGISIDDDEVIRIASARGAVLLGRSSKLMPLKWNSFNGDYEDEDVVESDCDFFGPSLAIQMPLLKASRFRCGGIIPEEEEEVQAPFAILVLVLPVDGDRRWTGEELEIVEVVADQVAVALSHAAILEESMAVREQLMERNLMLSHERRKEEQADMARLLFQKVMGQQMKGPIRSIIALFSALQVENLKKKREALVLVNGGLVMSSLVEDSVNSMGGVAKGRMLELNSRPFNLHLMLEDAVNVSKLICTLRNVPFECLAVPSGIPKGVIGDERRIFGAVLSMVGTVLASSSDQGGPVVLCVDVEGTSQECWKQPSVFEDSVKLRFKVGRAGCVDDGSTGLTSVTTLFTSEHQSSSSRSHGSIDVNHTICGRIAEVMHGSLSATSTSVGVQNLNRMDLRIRLQQEKRPGDGVKQRCLDRENALTLLRGMKILLSDTSDINRAITRRILQRAGCELTVVSSWSHCLEALFLKANQFRILLIDMQILEDGQHDISARVLKLRLERWLLIIALVAHPDLDTKQRCVENGIHGVIRTPVVLQEMIEEIKTITQKLQEAAAL